MSAANVGKGKLFWPISDFASNSLPIFNYVQVSNSVNWFLLPCFFRDESLQLAKDHNTAYRTNQTMEIQMKATCAELRMKVFHSSLLKRDLEDLQAGRCTRSRLALGDGRNLELYTREIISRLTIRNANQFPYA